MKTHLKKLLPIFMLICLGMFKTATAEEKKPEADPEATPVEIEKTEEDGFASACCDEAEKEEAKEDAGAE